MKLNDIYEFDLFIDNLNIFETPGVVFGGAEIFEAIANPLPVCELDMSIPVGWLDGRTIVDGTLIRFHLKSDHFKLDSNYDFRIFNIERIQVNQKFAQVKINGIIDSYTGYTTGNKYNACMNSSEMFTTIGSALGLTPEVDKTNDKQLWVAGENNTYEFLNKIAQNGWIDETSGMIWFIDRDKRLIYKNLTSLFRQRQEKIYKFVQSASVDPEDKQYGYTSIEGSIQSGTNNLRNGGYGGKDPYFDLLSYSYKQADSKKVIAESRLINISKELSKGLNTSWFPFDVGNFHKQYYNAYKQNKRILSTYSSYLVLESQFFQPYRLGQIVDIDYIDSQTEDNKVTSLTGCYMIDAIHTKITMASITAIVELMAQGLNGTPLTREVY